MRAARLIAAAPALMQVAQSLIDLAAEAPEVAQACLSCHGEALAEGIRTGHPSMPEFRFDPDEAAALIAYLKTLER